MLPSFMVNRLPAKAIMLAVLALLYYASSYGLAVGAGSAAKTAIKHTIKHKSTVSTPVKKGGVNPSAKSAANKVIASKSNKETPSIPIEDIPTLKEPLTELRGKQENPYPINGLTPTWALPVQNQLKHRLGAPNHPVRLSKVTKAQPPVAAVEASGTIAILPVLPEGKLAFSDASLLLAEQLALQLMQRYPGVNVLSPTQTLATFKQNGAWPTYTTFAKTFSQSSWVNPGLWEQLAGLAMARQPSLPPISRLILVDARLNWLEQTKAVGGPWQRFTQWSQDGLPQTGRTFLETHSQVFEVNALELVPLWQSHTQQLLVTEHLGGATQNLAANPQAEAMLKEKGIRFSEEWVEQAPYFTVFKALPFTAASPLEVLSEKAKPTLSKAQQLVKGVLQPQLAP